MKKKVYLANCTAPVDEMVKRIKFVEKHKGNYIMLDIITLGWSALQKARDVTKRIVQDMLCLIETNLLECQWKFLRN